MTSRRTPQRQETHRSPAWTSRVVASTTDNLLSTEAARENTKSRLRRAVLVHHRKDYVSGALPSN